MRKIFARTAAALAVAFFGFGATPASARWLKATSDHVIVYSEGSEKSLRDYVTKLESFDRLLSAMIGLKDQPKGTKLSVYLLSSDKDLKQVSPDISPDFVGFYSAEEGAIAAFSAKGNEWQPSQEILFHEYAHHFQQKLGSFAYPLWFTEGFAEYVGTMEIKTDVANVGQASAGRAYTLIDETWLPWEAIVTTTSLEGMKRLDIERFYAQGWFLTHFLMRDQQLNMALLKYLRTYSSEGKADWPSFLQSLGMDSATLDKRLKAYSKKGMTYTQFKLAPVAPASVHIEALPASADGLLLAKARADLNRRFAGESLSEAAEKGDKQAIADMAMVQRVRAKAAQYKADPFAQRALASVEISFGDANSALTALQAIPDAARDAEWFYLDGLARFTIAGANQEKSKQLLTEARKSLGKAFKIDPDHFPTLFLYYRTFEAEGVDIDDNVLNSLVRAYDLAPQVDTIGGAAAVNLMRHNRGREAAFILRTMASKPHMTDGYRKQILALLEKARESPDAKAAASASSASAH